ncbi:hypothetical protein [Tropicibacter oceani]|uniref:Major facilitator superfamily (MFS) profile domain-containing protein n=1 Tax=Tropicibacter oceani TaxID=3058420 RepID=A0ABY8QCQ4_9RHOB|nr:hypothetical protein [Tropicibacter oceani]WGW02340.1 hypothetical protein QF118_10285 [Tropicibacter oceani]
MSEESRSNWYLGILMCLFIPAGTVVGGFLGNEEFGLLGAIIGGLAGGFLGFLAAWLAAILTSLTLVAVIILGPIALALAFGYYALSSFE